MMLTAVAAVIGVPWLGAMLLVLASRRRQDLRDRLLRAATAHLQVSPEPEAEEASKDSLPQVTRLLRRFGWYQRLDAHLRRLDIPLSPAEYAACIATLYAAAPGVALAWASRRWLPPPAWRRRSRFQRWPAGSARHGARSTSRSSCPTPWG